MEEDEECITGLSLGLGIGWNNNVPKNEKHKVKKPILPNNSLDLSFELCPEEEQQEQEHEEEDHDESVDNKGEILSLNDNNQRNDAKSDDRTKNKIGIRKKLRLTKDQLAMLESNFKLHTTLTSAQKEALAQQLNLKARQIEVWFQNRRARTKLKQTEVDCELLKRRCQSLTDENRRLKKELQELRSLKVAAKSPLYIQLSKTATCSSCEKLVKSDPMDE